MNIKQKLLLLFSILAILPVAIIGILSYKSAKEALLEQQIESLEAVVDSRILSISHVLQLRVEQARQIAGTYLPRQLQLDGNHDPFIVRNLQEHVESIYESINTVHQTNPNSESIEQETTIKKIEVWDVNGTLVAGTGAFSEDNILPEGLFQKVRDEGFHFGGYLQDPLTGESFLYILEEIRNLESNEFSGVVSLKVGREILNDISLHLAGLGDTGEIILFQMNQESLEIITNLRNTRQIPLIETDSQVALPMQQVTHGLDGKGISTDYRGVEVGAVWKKIPGLNWGIVGKVDTAEIYHPVNELGRRILMIGLILFSVSILLAWYSARSISDPVQKLVDIFSRISRGELGQPVRVKSDDEIGILARSANETIRYLKYIIHHATKLGAGNYDVQIEPRGNQDELGHALKRMMENLIAYRSEVETLLDKSKKQAHQLLERQQIIEQTNEDLMASKARIEAILEASVDAIITIDIKGRILSYNRSAQEMFGYGEEELIGKNVSVLMPIPYSEQHDTYIKNYLETGEKKIIGIGRQVQGLRKDGTVFPIDLAVSEVKWEGDRIFSGIIKDISERRELERRVLQIGEEERERIGQDLHDGLGQMLTGIRMVSENLSRKLSANGVPGADEVKEIAEMVRQSDEFARTLARGMVQVDLDKKGLSVALQTLCKQSEKIFGIQSTFHETGVVQIDQHSIALNLYRIAQESIHNAVKHGEAGTVRIRLSHSAQHLSLVIDDDGKGFSHKDNDNTNSGMGIQIMKYRAGIIGGILQINRTDEQLTRVRCIIPNDMTQF